MFFKVSIILQNLMVGLTYTTVCWCNHSYKICKESHFRWFIYFTFHLHYRHKTTSDHNRFALFDNIRFHINTLTISFKFNSNTLQFSVGKQDLDITSRLKCWIPSQIENGNLCITPAVGLQRNLWCGSDFNHIRKLRLGN